MAISVTIDEKSKKVTIIADLIESPSKSGMNIKLVENNGFPSVVKGLLYKGQPVKLAVNCTIDNPDMPAEERAELKKEMQLQQAKARVARLEGR